MSASAPTPTPGGSASGSPSPATTRGAQVAFGVFLAILIGLLAFRGYANRLGARPTEPTTTDLIDLNFADQKELAQVPGVGPKVAEAIVDHRRLHGPYKSVDELRKVRGIGPITFEKIRNQFRVSALPQPTLTDPPASPDPVLPPPPASAPSARPTGGGAKKIQPGDAPINVNTATAEELQRLPGVGPTTARNIIATRTATPFESVNDLDKVKGIGPKTLAKLRPFVVVR